MPVRLTVRLLILGLPIWVRVLDGHPFKARHFASEFLSKEKTLFINDPFFKSFANSLIKYPPYNFRKLSEDKYALELAVAGFDKSELTVEVSGDKLIISGHTDNKTQDYILKGISQRDFKNEWKLLNTLEVDSSEYVNGILRVFLDTVAASSNTKKVEIQ